MPRIVECVPNFSEGRRVDVIDRICAEITAVPGVRLLDREADESHNRAVVTFIGSPDACARAAFNAARMARALIDLTTHTGEHPRMGATDVIPFVPVAGVTMEECVALANSVGQRIGDELDIPVFLYEQAAKRPERENLAVVRKGQFEALRDLIGTDPDRDPDYGPKKIHPTAGATAVGARDFLVAYNMYLSCNDKSIAQNIAKAIRHSSGGFRFCKAAGFEIEDRQCVQVSMNLTNPKQTPAYRVLETVKAEAARYGVTVTSTEVVGLAPLYFVSDTAEYYLQIERWKSAQILETNLLEEETTAGFLESIGARTPTPGGGSVAAYAGAMGSALVSMVARLNDKKSGEPGPLHDMIEKSETLVGRLNTLVKDDSDAFDAVMASFKLPDDDRDKIAKQQAATIRATEVPLDTMRAALAVMALAKESAAKSKRSCLSDAGVAAYLAHAALCSARLNVLINLPGIEDEVRRQELAAAAADLLSQSTTLVSEVDQAMSAALTG
jgi:glutamate formiminotransferase/formiminotetrahydrofolate cyclodeaminase